MEISELVKEISNLKEIIKLINDNVKFQLQVQWAALAFVVAASGASLLILARTWFNRELDKRMTEFKKTFDNKIKQKFEVLKNIGVSPTGPTYVTLGGDEQPEVFMQVHDGKRCHIDVKGNNVTLTNLEDTEIIIDLLILYIKE
ncbi:MAG: hypothetical protein FH756_01485 [Firmicutes bacterium]|nr:hypothetical protein [Bacillota bacterium]